MTEPEDVLGFWFSTGPRTRRGHAPPPVAVLSHDDRATTLALADHGPGMPDEAKTGLGMKLIDLLCR
jgi:hypothetical protein